jgi:toxin ParE2
VKVEFTSAAELELDEAVEFYNSRQPGLGQAFAAEAQKAADLILTYPKAWQALDGDTRRCRLNRFPYGLVYTIEHELIVILAVMHLHKRPGYWRARV